MLRKIFKPDLVAQLEAQHELVWIQRRQPDQQSAKPAADVHKAHLQFSGHHSGLRTRQIAQGIASGAAAAEHVPDPPGGLLWVLLQGQHLQRTCRRLLRVGSGLLPWRWRWLPTGLALHADLYLHPALLLAAVSAPGTGPPCSVHDVETCPEAALG